MSTQTAIMGYSSPLPSERWHLARKLLLLFLLTVALTLGLVILFQERPDFPLLLFNILSDTGLGVSAGLGARLVLRRRHGLIRGLASAAVVLSGLILLGALTEWRAGIGPLSGADWSQLLRWRWPFSHLATDLVDVSHMVIGINTSWMALRAWNPAGRTLPAALRSAAPLRGPERSAAPRPVLLSGAASPMRSPRPAGRIRAPAPAARRRSAARRHRNLGQGRLQIQFSTYEEHRCPYCLEVVRRNDARGVVECKVCHALHHKDCWDITGACQVPHLNT